MRPRRLIVELRRAALFAALLTPAAFAQAVAMNSADVTVRLFFIHHVNTVTLTADESALHSCSACRDFSFGHPLQIRSGHAGDILVEGKSVRRLGFSGRVKIQSDGGQTADAAGRWTISAAEDGLHIVLALPSERYVMAVLSSESAADDSVESLKALAVTARSFALSNPHRHGLDGVCDSTHCQAMVLGPVSAHVEQAVRETAGERLWWNGVPVTGYFTQNSGGMTEDAAAVWGGKKQPWLIAHADPYCRDQPAQWHAEVDKTELRSALQSEGWKLGNAIDHVRVLDRDVSGRARRVEVAAGAQRVIVPASALRFAVDRGLGWNRLRSDWYEVHDVQGRVVFDGKGHGHGVGLCQEGATRMAQQGQNYRAILSFYFPGTEVRIGASDHGWQRQQGKGWALRSTLQSSVETAAVLAEGDAAQAQARSRWPGTASPEVTIYPTTELFRQATGEPGWSLGATRGEWISLQPLTIVQRHGGLRELLLHEFLHSMVEHDAGDAAPLWLREGLVETLAGQDAASVTIPVRQIETMLRNPKSLDEAQSAHRAAGKLVRDLVAQYGLANVRGWLRNGVPSNVVAR